MRGRHALLIGTMNYTDKGLRALRSPGADIEELRRVLEDPDVGDYEVTTALDLPYSEIGERVGSFLANRHRDDLLLLYFSCHGLKNDDDELYLAAANTRLTQLEDTGVPAARLARQLDRSKARRIVLLLDCCFAGAFPPGGIPKSSAAVTLDEFRGRGQVIISATSALEYAFEGGDVPQGSPNASPSVFTSAIVRGFDTGDADVDRDGLISTSDIFAYLSSSLSTQSPVQTPTMHATALQGTFPVAKSRLGERRGTIDAVIGTTDLGASGEQAPQAASLGVQPRRGLADLLSGAFDELEVAAVRDVSPRTVPANHADLTALCGGFNPGDLILVTGESGSGKSTFAFDAMRAAALRSGLPTLFFTLESSARDATLRTLSAECRVPLQNLRSGSMSDESWARLARRMGELVDAPLQVVERAPTVASIAATAAAVEGLRFVVVDGLQLVGQADFGGETQTASNVRALKLLAKELDVPIMATVAPQLAMNDEPQLREAVVGYADIVVDIRRPDLHDYEHLRAGEADLVVVKNRQGPKAMVTVAFQGHYSRFVDIRAD